MFDFKREPALWGALVFLGVFMGFADTMIATGLARAARSIDFEQTPGVVTRSEIGRGRKGSVDFKLEYTYTVNGVQFTGKDYHAQPQLVGNGYWFKARDSLPVGTHVVVCYNPANSADAVLVPGLRPDSVMVVWMLMPFNLLLVGFAWGAWVRFANRCEFEPSLSRCAWHAPAGWVVRPRPDTGPVSGAFLGLFVITFAGFFVGGGYTLVFDSAPWWFVAALWTVGLVGAVAIGLYASREVLIHVNELEGTVSVPTRWGRETVARDRVIGLEVTPETRKKNGNAYEVYAVTLRWRKFDRQETTKLAEYAERINAEAFVAWLRERLALIPVAAPGGI